MRRFRFVGDPEEYLWDTLPVVGKIYDGDFIWEYQGEKAKRPLQEWFNEEPEFGDWQEVFDTPKPFHKDTDLGYYAGLALQALIPVCKDIPDHKMVVFSAIEISRELIKQLDEQGKSPDNLSPH